MSLWPLWFEPRFRGSGDLSEAGGQPVAGILLLIQARCEILAEKEAGKKEGREEGRAEGLTCKSALGKDTAVSGVVFEFSLSGWKWMK